MGVTDVTLQSENLCDEEMKILDHCAMNDEDFEDYYFELRQAAFDDKWDGETDEEQFKEEVWQSSYRAYQNYLTEWQEHPLRVSLERGQEEYFVNMINSGADLGVRDGDGRSLLHVAAAHGLTKAADVLIDNGLDVDDFASFRQTPLMVAIEKRQTGMAGLLLNRRADIEARDATGLSVLMYAAYNDLAGLVADIVDRGADVDAKSINGNGATALMYAALEGHENSVNVLIDRGADVNAQDNDNETALMKAANYGRTDTITLLIGRGADVHIRDARGATARTHAMEHGHAKDAALLQAHDLAAALPPVRREPPRDETDDFGVPDPQPVRPNRPRL
jgi:ankyrin repeat protein